MRGFLAIGAIALVAAACGGESSDDLAATTTTSTAPQKTTNEMIVDLWREVDAAIASSSVERFASVLDDPALLMQRFYWVDYCIDYCPSPPAPPAAPPVVDVLATSADGSAAVALVSTTSQWSEEDPIPISAIVRVDDTPTEGWQITMTDTWAPADNLPPVPSGELMPLGESGRTLTAAYLEVVEAMRETGEYPPDSQFANGQFTNGYLDALATHKEAEPWEEENFELHLAPENDAVGFTVEGDDGRDLHCALYAWSSTVRHVDGQPITPLSVLGDFAHLIEDGAYASFTTDGFDSVCIIEDHDASPVVLAYGSFRTGLAGTPIEAS